MPILQVPGQFASVALGSVSSGNVVLPTKPSVGNLVVVGVSLSGSLQTCTVTDANGNAYTAATSSPAVGNSLSANIFYLKNAPASASPTLTVTLTGGAVDTNMWVAEFSGADKVSPNIASATHTSATSSTNIDDPTITPALDGCLLFSTCVAGQSISVTTSPWNGVGSPANGNYAEYYIQRKAAAQAIGFTQAPTGIWTSIVTAFKPAPDLVTATRRSNSAAISTPVSLGSNNDTGSGTVVITTGATANVGDSVLVAIACQSGTVSSVVDSAGNLYVQDLTATNTNACYIFSSILSSQLASGGTITVNKSVGFVTNAAAIFVSGINSFSPLDTTTSATGNNTTPSATLATLNANDFVLGVVFYDGTPTYTQDGTWTGITGVALSGVNIGWAYRKTTTIGNQTYAPILGSGFPLWVDLIAGYDALFQTVQLPLPVKNDDESGLIEEITQKEGWFDINILIKGWFDPDLVGPSGTITPKSISATVTTTATLTLTKTFVKVISATVTSTSSFLKNVGKQISATCASTASVVKSVAKKIAITSTTTGAVVANKVLNVLITATSTTTLSVKKTVGKIITGATATSTASMVRSVGKIVAATGTSTVTIIKSITHKISATATTTSTVLAIKVILVSLSATVTTTASLIKQVGKVIVANTITTTGSLSRTIGKKIAITSTTTSSVLKAISKLISATNTTTASVKKAFVKQPITATVTTTVSVLKTVGKLFSTTVTTTASMLKNVGKKITTTVTTSVILTALPSAITFLVNLTATVTTSVPLVRRSVGKVIVVPMNLVPIITKKVNFSVRVNAIATSILHATAFVIFLPLTERIIRAIEALRSFFTIENERVIVTVRDNRVLKALENARLVLDKRELRVIYTRFEDDTIITEVEDGQVAG